MSESPGKQFGALIEPWLDQLFRSAYRLTGNSPDAEDLVQDTCIRALSSLEQFKLADAPLAWLMRVQYNLFIDGVRRRRRDAIRPLGDTDTETLAGDESAEPDRSLADGQGLSAIQRAWARLTLDQRGLLALIVEGYKLAEIHEITGLEINVINARLHRARRSLARHLRNDAEQEALSAAEHER